MIAALTLTFVMILIVAETRGQYLVGQQCCEKDWKDLVGPVTESYTQNLNGLSTAAFQTAFGAWEAKMADYLYRNQPEGICRGRLSYKCERNTCQCVDLAPAFKYVNQTEPTFEDYPPDSPYLRPGSEPRPIDCVGVEGSLCLEDGSVGCQQGLKCVVNGGQANGRFRHCVADPDYTTRVPYWLENFDHVSPFTWGPDVTHYPFHAAKEMAANDLSKCLEHFQLRLNDSCDKAAAPSNWRLLKEKYGVDQIRDIDWYAKVPLDEWKKQNTLYCYPFALVCTVIGEGTMGTCTCYPGLLPCPRNASEVGLDPATLCLDEYAKVLALANVGQIVKVESLESILFAIGVLCWTLALLF